jgi:H+/Cl- antiporter ClcA
MDPGSPSIKTAFGPDAMPSWSWALKLIFTVITLGSGFKGGEVTPLFFMGATAGNALGTQVGLPSGLGAAAGLAAVFAGASRTPVACTLLGLELFGWAAAPYVAVACWASQLSSGHKSIYEAPNRTHREP